MSRVVQAPRVGEIGLGDRVRDDVTGFTGIVTAMTFWLYGCVRVAVQPEELDREKGKAQDAVYFDEPQLTLVEREVHRPKPLRRVEDPEPLPARQATGGPPREGAGFAR